MYLRSIYLIPLYIGFALSEQGFNFVDEGLAQLSGFALQCTDGPLSKIAVAADPIPLLFETIGDFCDASQTKTFKSAMAEYDKCSGEDLNGFIETFWDAIVGVGITCAEYFYDLSNLFTEEFMFNPQLPLPRIPDECAEHFLGDNPMGNLLRRDMTSRGKELGCLAVLGHNLPSCTLREWPVPVVGELLKFIACTFSKMKDSMVGACNDELQLLGDCLPSVSSMKNPSDEQCQQWRNACTIDQLKGGKMPSFQMALPAPLSAAPLEDICVSEDIDSQLNGVPAQFQAFLDGCAEDKDMAFWNENRFEASKYKSKYRGKSSSDSSSSSGETESNALEKSQSKSSSSNGGSSGGGSGGGGFKVFAIGLLSGLAVAVGFLVYQKRRNRENYGMMMGINYDNNNNNHNFDTSNREAIEMGDRTFA